MIMTNRQLYEMGVRRFDEINLEDSQLNAREILGKVLCTDCRGAEYEMLLEKNCDDGIPDRFLSLCERRAKGEPLQYLVGEWEFYGLPFKVGEGVLIPRQDTETLVELVLSKTKGQSGLTVLDLCSGSGCVAVSLEKNMDKPLIYAVEKSDEAYKYLEKNIRLNDCSIKAVKGDVTSEKLAEDMLEADVIAANPPYLTCDDMDNLQKEVTFEPSLALFGGDDGLDFYRLITITWKNKLKTGGLMAFEIGINQEDDVMKILVQHGFENVRCRRDLCGVNRVVFGIKK